MIASLFSLSGFIGGALIIDWSFAGRLSSYSTEFDYRYWPFSRTRWIGIAAFIAASISIWAQMNGLAPKWTAIPFILLIATYILTLLLDLSAQRRAGYQAPPRYSDGQYGS